MLEDSGAPGEAHRRATDAYLEAFFATLAASGVELVFVSPGSRSTPLALAADRVPGLDVRLILDERSAAFLALGVGRQTARPAALICTSGTAATHYLPAVTEAHYGRVPMIVLTADRPPELRDWGAGQTIDQLGLYGTAVRRFTEMPVLGREFGSLRHARASAQRAVQDTLGAPPGPVHLNWPLREPLEPSLRVSDRVSEESQVVEPVRPVRVEVSAEDVASVAALMHANASGWIVCGPMPPCGDRDEALAELGRRSGWPILADPLSGLRRGPQTQRASLVVHSDLWLREKSVAERVAPKMILRFGDTPTSKALRLVLEAHPPEHFILVDPAGDWADPGHHVTQTVRADPARFAAALTDQWVDPRAECPAAALTLDLEQRAAGIVDQQLAIAGDLDELRVVRGLERTMPRQSTLFVSSSMPIRDVDAVLSAHPDPLKILANRGANGIDGVTSTALGAALADREPVVLLTGDLALLHDLGGLLAAKNYKIPILILVLNNEGGGIFSFLPIAERAEPHVFETFFRTPQGVSIERVARLFDLTFDQVHSDERLEEVLSDWFAAGVPGPHLVEVPIDRDTHVERFRTLVGRVGQAVRDGVGI